MSHGPGGLRSHRETSARAARIRTERGSPCRWATRCRRSSAEITRGPTKDPSYHAWRVRLGWPRDGEISFGAKGFHQVLLAEPIISETNFLTGAQRRQMLG